MPDELRPSGIPISRALLVRSGIANEDLREAIDAVNTVHGDGDLPPIPVLLADHIVGDTESPEGRFSFNVESDGGITPLAITLRRAAPHRGFILLHEVGHFLDLLGLPGAGFAWASAQVRELDQWRQAVSQSRAVTQLGAMTAAARTDTGRVRRLRNPDELWARSYAQFVAVRSGIPALVHALESLRRRPALAMYYPLQWDDDDFREIERATADLFRRLGWMESRSARRPNGKSRT